MNAENIAGLVLAVLLARLPGRGAALPGAVLMTFAGWAQLVALIVVARRSPRRCSAATWRNVYEGGPSRLDRVFGPVERLHLPRLPHRSRARAALERLRVLAARVQRRRRAACST